MDTRDKPEELEEVQSPTTRADEVVEIEWETIKEVYELKSSLAETENYLSQLLLQHEKSKERLLHRMSTIESALYESARRIRDEKEVSQEITYELKLPQNPGEKGYFLRKEM